MVQNNAGVSKCSRLGVLEFGESISELEDLEGEIYDPESVVEVLTLAHAHNVASEQLGFTLVAGRTGTLLCGWKSW